MPTHPNFISLLQDSNYIFHAADPVSFQIHLAIHAYLTDQQLAAANNAADPGALIRAFVELAEHLSALVRFQRKAYCDVCHVLWWVQSHAALLTMNSRTSDLSGGTRYLACRRAHQTEPTIKGMRASCIASHGVDCFQPRVLTSIDLLARSIYQALDSEAK